MARFQIINHGMDTLTLEEAAQVANTNYDTIYNLLDLGVVESIYPGNFDFVTIKSLERYLNSLRYLIVLGKTDYFDCLSKVPSINRKSRVKNNEECVWYVKEE